MTKCCLPHLMSCLLRNKTVGHMAVIGFVYGLYLTTKYVIITGKEARPNVPSRIEQLLLSYVS
jgi:hypothetical protein